MEEEQGLTLGEIIKIVFKRIWWLLGATVLCAVLTVLLVKFWYNPSKQYYEVSYELTYPGMSSNRYPDGTEFLLSDFVSLENLTDVKDGNTKFADIDVEEMHQKNAIEISYFVDKDNELPSNIKVFTIKIQAKYCKDPELAAEFLRAIAEYPVNKVNESIDNTDYDIYLKSYDLALTYEEKLSILSNYKQSIINHYNSLISLYSADYLVNGNSLTSYRVAAEKVFDSDDYYKLQYEMLANKLVLDTENYISKAANTITVLERDIKTYTDEIAVQEQARDRAIAASGSLATVEAFNNRITSLTASIANSNNNILVILETLEKISNNNTLVASYENGTLDIANLAQTLISTPYATTNVAFEAKLDAFLNQIQAQSAILKPIRSEVYKDNTTVTAQKNEIKKEGGIGTIIAAVLGAVIGFAIAAIVIYLVDSPKYKQQKLAAEAQTATPAQPETQPTEE